MLTTEDALRNVEVTIFIVIKQDGLFSKGINRCNKMCTDIVIMWNCFGQLRNENNQTKQSTKMLLRYFFMLIK